MFRFLLTALKNRLLDFSSFRVKKISKNKALSEQEKILRVELHCNGVEKVAEGKRYAKCCYVDLVAEGDTRITTCLSQT